MSQVASYTPPVHHHDPEAARRAFEASEAAMLEESRQKKQRTAIFYSLGRALIASLFLAQGINKWIHFEDTRRMLANLDFTETSLLLGIGIGVELLCGAMLLVGFKVRAAAVVLASYLAMLTLMIHRDFSQPQTATAWWMNLALVGALLMLYAHGAGRLSMDRRMSRQNVPG